MVGDNLSTDIQFGINSGVRTLLVMGGGCFRLILE